MPDDAVCHTVTLDVSSDEYSQVEKLFAATMPVPQPQLANDDLMTFQWQHIVKIERIQNPLLYTQYMAKKNDIGQHNSSGLNEKVLFYGCSRSVTNQIIHCGFSSKFAGNNGMYIPS